ncbi:non-specific lipid transfer protein GPI-anchored 1 [Asparagus officinalis]|uniref:non-specific lipid transfer protein GPI-anchored 1 n=1 Tax=Asparagus officinalis TaxID=4686 RepID=UPI00098DF09D|nr:non-specific lipid transfer protein GPI-anchored 1 [Asparagus officinalis]
MKICASIILSLFLSFSLVSCDPASSPLQDKCSPEFTKLGECLSYAAAKTDTPSSTCCASVSDIKQKDPVCLCYIIQQAHSGGSSATSLGLQMDRLIKLPAACKLASVNISECPRILNLSPSSPDYGIFTNATKAATTPAVPSGSSAASSSTGSGSSSGGIMNKINLAGIFAATMISALCSAIF